MSCGLELSWSAIEEQLALYDKTFSDEDPLFRLYRDIVQAWCRYREHAANLPSWEPEQVKELMRQGRYLLSEKPLAVEPRLFKALLEEIISAAAGYHPEKDELNKLLQLSEMRDENIDQFLQVAVSFDHAQAQRYVLEKGWVEKTGLADGALLVSLIFAALTPFFVGAAEAAAASADAFTLWQEGYCPVCGRKPGMAKLRAEDGARILECCLCHAQWQFSRLECPFCRNKDPEKLHFFYTDEYPGRRVQLCEHCKNYLKTAVVKEIGREVVLELDNVFTLQLDYVARREGYRPGEDLAVLI